jgi:hypothetical protein
VKKMSLGDYEELVHLIDEEARRNLELHRLYNRKEFEIITTFDFKAEYKKDNEKIRKAHVQSELSELLEAKDESDLRLDELKRALKLEELSIEYGG